MKALARGRIGPLIACALVLFPCSIIWAKTPFRDIIWNCQTDDLTDNQAMRLYKGWPGRMWITDVFNAVEPRIQAARDEIDNSAALIELLRNSDDNAL